MSRIKFELPKDTTATFKVEDGFAVVDIVPNEIIEEKKPLIKRGSMPSLSSVDFKRLRESKGLTPAEVEVKTGVSKSYVTRIEQGKFKRPAYVIIKALLDLYYEK